jgi:phosphoribosylaminoimidazole-succinocarboxamide synthase
MNTFKFDAINFNTNIKLDLKSKGKVRDIYNVHNAIEHKNFIMFLTSNRCSAFDYHICNINNKGYFLTQIASYWFKNTRDIIDNHYLNHCDNYMLVKKCRPIKLEFIVRGYITGSCWRQYSKGERVFCGVRLEDNLKEFQQFNKPIITPTTKDEHDEPISINEIVRRNILTREQTDFIQEKAIQLYDKGRQLSSDKGLILVDTKYEFGFDENNNIILIDEIHTPDSSRYWVKKSFDNHLINDTNIVNLDKDAVRNYLKSIHFVDKITEHLKKNNSLSDYQIPDIPKEVKNKLIVMYEKVYKLFCCGETKYDLNEITGDEICDKIYGGDINNHHRIIPLFYHNLISKSYPFVMIIMGSDSDINHSNKILTYLKLNNIIGGFCVASAHKNTKKVLEILDYINTNYSRVIWVTVAGKSNALSGVVSANTHFPVMACPPFENDIDMMVNIQSTLQMPTKVPVMTVLNINNLAESCSRIFNMSL